MRKLYGKVVRIGLLWVAVLLGMAAMAGTSAVVLASGPTPPPVDCSLGSSCWGNVQCGALTCKCTGVSFPNQGTCGN